MAGLSTGTTATTTQAKELCIGCIALDLDISTYNPSNSFTEVTERASGAPDLTVLERIVSATGTYGTTANWGDEGLPQTIPREYALCGAIATFKSDEIDASISINTSTATATLLAVTENHGSSISISVTNASVVMPNVIGSASSQTSATLSTASATAPTPTFSAGTNQNISVSTATATLLTVTENHGSSISIEWEELGQECSGQAEMPAVTPFISFTLPVSTATANTLALTASGTANVNVDVMIADANVKDASATGGTSAVARRIIISCG